MGNIFKINRYEDPGPGIDKGAPKKKRFFLFWEIVIRKFWKLILINLLYVLFCIPIVTIGPATAGLTYVLRNFSQEEHAFLWGDFIDAFKKNWKQSVAMEIINAVVIVLLVVAIPFYYALLNSSWIFYIPFILCSGAGIVFVFMNYYIHLMIVSVNLKLKEIIKNAFYLSCVSVKTNLITTFFLLLILVPAVLFWSIGIPVFLFIGFAFVGLIVCFNSYQYILRYVVEPYYEKQRIADPEAALLEEEKRKEEVIFEDIGTKEIKVTPQKTKHKKGKTIR